MAPRVLLNSIGTLILRATWSHFPSPDQSLDVPLPAPPVALTKTLMSLKMWKRSRLARLRNENTEEVSSMSETPGGAPLACLSRRTMKRAAWATGELPDVSLLRVMCPEICSDLRTHLRPIRVDSVVP